ncbi:MAG: response regulator [Candidatus Obscuribacterales bacterium]|nr:response regulator [Candidatus Obscuribacterales bacterium]
MSKLLVVEDDIVQAEGLRYILEDGRHDVTIAGSGEIALSLLKTDSFELVLSDVVMPGISGYDLCKQIKAEYKETPVILVTALGELKDLIGGLLCGADNFLTKPYEPEELLAQIEKVVSSQGKPGGPICDPNTGVCLIDNKFMMNMDRRRILDWLVSTFDEFLKARQKHGEERLEEERRRILERERRLNTLMSGVISKLECSDEAISSVIETNHLEKAQQVELENARKMFRDALESVRKEKDAALV